MDKSKIIAQVAQKSGYAKWEVNKIADSLLETVFDTLQQGEKVALNGFGKFDFKVRKARGVLNPKNKELMHIPEKINVTFAISRKFKPAEGVMEKIKNQPKIFD